MEDRENERDRLASPGIGAADDVVAAEGDGNDGALNRRRFFESADRDPFEERRLEAERVERYGRGVVIGLRPVRRLRTMRRLERRAAAAVSGAVAVS